MRRWVALVLTAVLLFPGKVNASETKYVALTLDDGPSGHYTQRLLEGLQKRNVKATFLLCGYRMEQYPGMAETIFRQGHEIGLHGYSHKDMSAMTYTQVAKEIADTKALLPEGCRPAFLRTPGGAWSATVAQAASDAGLALLKWSVDPRDWATHDAAAVTAAVVDCVSDGDIILLHDMCDCSVNAALDIVDRLLAEGFHFVTVSQLAEIKGVQPKKGKLYCSFR